ncbi:MAG: L-histidine N(alpha)-methyltransferase [Pseudomonadota bacterium]
MQDHIECLYFHSSQFPDQIAREHEESFLQRRINHKFHYHTTYQSQQWLDLHNTYSPAQDNQGYHQAYKQCFYTALDRLNHDTFDFISLGCGGGEKEVLLHTMLTRAKQTSIAKYYPVDVSHSLTITAAQKMRQEDSELIIQPMVCDLLHTEELLSYMPRSGGARLITFFGMIPNFNPDQILPVLTHFLAPGDLLLFSANLAPGDHYASGVESVLPQYNNSKTKSWLMSVLQDVGISQSDGEITVTIETDSAEPGVDTTSLKKITAYFTVKRLIRLKINDKTIHWQPGERVQLFFSYRYTTSLVKSYLKKYNIQVLHDWEFSNQEEGLYLCRRVSG